MTTYTNLKVSFYIPPAATLISIQAQELQKNKDYQMIADLPLPGAIAGHWATFSPWPVSDVLAQVNLHPAQLGVVVTLKLPTVTNLFAPALFYTTQAPTDIKSYSIFFSSDKAVEQVRCTVLDEANRNKSSSNTPYTCSLPNRETSFLGGVTTCFEVNAANLPAGLVTVTITGEYLNEESGDSMHAVLHFYHQPKVNIQ